jgi:hypothetical protein
MAKNSFVYRDHKVSIHKHVESPLYERLGGDLYRFEIKPPGSFEYIRGCGGFMGSNHYKSGLFQAAKDFINKRTCEQLSLDL